MRHLLILLHGAVTGLALDSALVPDARAASAGPEVTWRRAADRMDASVDERRLPEVLESLSAATRWEVFFEPDMQDRISARFTNLTTREALRRLLGELNFALVTRGRGTPALYIYRTSIQEATRAIRPPGARSHVSGSGTNAIPNEWIVRLKKDGTLSAEALAAKVGATLSGRLDGSRAYRLRFDDEESAESGRAALSSISDVASVEANYPITSPDRLDPLAASSVPALDLKPRNVPAHGQLIIGLVDTGVQPGAMSGAEFLLPQVSVVGESPVPGGEPTHGTSMAETLLRGLQSTGEWRDGAPVRILPVDVYGGSEATTSFDVAAGIIAAARGGARVINLSMGSESSSPFLMEVVAQARKQGIMLVGAAGNEPVTTPTYPAAYPEVLAVTSGDRTGRLASYANRGSFVDAVAPGASVVHFNQQAFLGVGTSYAAAFFSGAAAGLAVSMPNPGQLEAELRKRFGFTPPKSP